MSDMPSRAGLALGAGTAASLMLPKLAGWQSIALVNASSYAASQAMGAQTVDVLAAADIDLDRLGLDAEAQEAVRAAAGALTWAVASAVVVPVVRFLPLPLPRLAKAAAAGAAVAWANDEAVRRVAALRAKKAGTDAGTPTASAAAGPGSGQPV